VAQQKRFFHWELEFPEVFFDAHGLKLREERGFDAAVGNPPYYTLTLGKKQQQADEQELIFFEDIYPQASEYKMNTFALVSEKALSLLKRGGQWGFILPNTVLTNYYLKNLREWIVTNFHLGQFIDLRFRVFEEAEIGGNALVIAGKPLTSETVLTTGFKVANEGHEVSLNSASLTIVPQTIFAEMPDYKFLTDSHIIELLMRIRKCSQTLGEVTKIYQGIITGDNKRFLAKEKVTSTHEKILRGEDVERYGISFGETYILYDPQELWSNTDPEMFLVPSKIVSRQTSDHLVAALDTERFFTLDSTHVIHPKVDHYFFITLFNSRLLNFIYQQVVPEVGKTFAQVKAVNLKQLPIRRIIFSTAHEERGRLLDKGKQLYEHCLSKGGNDCVLGFVEHQLTQTPERADVVHDLLAFLAEQVIAINKKKQTEVKSFVTWLERAIGATVDDLNNRTKVKVYHEYAFETLLAVLKQNRRKLTVNPDTRTVQDAIESEYNASIAKLSPLKVKIAATDRLIDLIVYRLYGLTEEEIAVVEGKRQVQRRLPSHAEELGNRHQRGQL
jgi:hypothetical protein